MECATVLTAEGLTSTGIARGSSCDRDTSLNGRVQEIASEVLRLRLVQSQHKQLEQQLKAAVEKLQNLPSEKVLLMRTYLEHGLRLGSVRTLGGLSSGVGPESLCGLMECLCTVNDEQLPSQRQDDLLTATRRLLQDPPALIERLARLPPASSMQSRRLAPFLLSCDSTWRGPLNDAGQCYETIRGWLSCYYQFSLISTQIQATNEQLQQQERLMDELGRDTEGGTGCAAGLVRPHTWRQYSGVRRSSSVQSTSSVGSHRSQSLANDRAAAVGLRHSPRSGAGLLGRTSTRESPLKSTPARGNLTDRSATTDRSSRAHGGSSTAQHSNPLYAPRGNSSASPIRSTSPGSLQPSGSKASLTARGPRDKNELSPRQHRFGGPTSSAGVLASARSRAGISASVPSPSTNSRAGAPPSSDRNSGIRRQIVPAVRTRRTPSSDNVPGSSSRGVGSLTARTGELDSVIEGQALASPRDVASASTMNRSRSLRSINEPPDNPSGLTPPLSSRGGKPVDTGRARGGPSAATQPSTAASRMSVMMGQPHVARTAVTSPHQQHLVVSQQPQPRVSRLPSNGYQPAPAASLGGTPAGVIPAHLRRGQHSRSVLTLPSTRTVPSPSTGMVPKPVQTQPMQAAVGDAGSGGTGGVTDSRQDFALGNSRSSPALDVRCPPTSSVTGPRYGAPPPAIPRHMHAVQMR